jgi:hypothetical protein
MAQCMKLIPSAVISGFEIHEFHQSNKTHEYRPYEIVRYSIRKNPLNGYTISVMTFLHVNKLI